MLGSGTFQSSLQQAVYGAADSPFPVLLHNTAADFPNHGKQLWMARGWIVVELRSSFQAVLYVVFS